MDGYIKFPGTKLYYTSSLNFIITIAGRLNHGVNRLQDLPRFVPSSTLCPVLRTSPSSLFLNFFLSFFTISELL